MDHFSSLVGQDDQGEEDFEKEAYLGPQMIYVTVLGLAGVDGVSQPLLPGAGGVKRE
jgi:hypothetical protein